MNPKSIRVIFTLTLALALTVCLFALASCGGKNNNSVDAPSLGTGEVLSGGYIFRRVTNEYGDGYELTSFRYYGEVDRGGVINIPSYVEGKPVIGISGADETSMKSAVLPDTLRYIHNSFRHCYDLASLVIPDSVISISGSSFAPARGANAVWRGCPKLVQTENSFAYVGDWLVYNDASTVGEPAIREGTAGIADGVSLLDLIDGDERLVIPEGVKHVGKLNFFDNNHIEDWVKELVLPDSLETVGDEAFAAVVNTQMPIVLKNVKYVGTEAFARGDYGEIVLPDTLEYLGARAFEGADIGRLTVGADIDRHGTGILHRSSVEELSVAASALWMIDRHEVEGTGENNRVTVGTLRVTEGALTERIGASGLKTLILGEGVMSVASNALAECTDIETIVIGNDNIEVNAAAFLACHSIKDATASASLLKLLDLSKLERVHVTTGTVRATDFSHVTTLKGIVIDAGVCVEDGAFAACTGLVSAAVPMSVLSVLPVGLRTLSITDGVTLNAAQIARFTALEDITLPKTLNAIGADAFSALTSLNSVHYGGTLSSWAAIRFENAFSNPLSVASGLYVGGELVEAVSGLTSLSPYAFAGYKALTALDLSGLTAIPEGAFTGCVGLTRVVISASVSEIGANAFFGCTALLETVFENTLNWSRHESATDTSGSEIYAYYLNNATDAAILLIDTYAAYIWRRMV